MDDQVTYVVQRALRKVGVGLTAEQARVVLGDLDEDVVFVLRYAPDPCTNAGECPDVQRRCTREAGAPDCWKGSPE